MPSIRSLTKDILISLSISLCLIVLAEVSFIFMKSIKANFSRSEREERKYQDRFIAFDKKVPIDILKKRQEEVGDHLMYKPWIQIGNYDHKGKYSTVISGYRQTNNSSRLKTCENLKTIWMFGGSTTYGVGVPSSQSIPSQLAEIAQNKNACINVFNFGVPYHYSKQEAIHFISKLFETDTLPDIAVFLDGLNEFKIPGAVIRGEPFFTPLLVSLIGKSRNPSTAVVASSSPINLKVIRYIKRKISKTLKITSSTAYSNFELPIGFNEKSAAEEIKSRLLKNTRHIGSICEAYAVDCYRFLQPVAAVDYSPPKDDSLTSWVINKPDRTERFKHGYGLIRSSKEFQEINGISFHDISSIFKEYVGIPYISSGHYSPRANKEIANKIFEKISTSIEP